MLQPQQADAEHSAVGAEPNLSQNGASSRRMSLARHDVPEWSNDFTDSHKPTAIGLSENDMLSMRVSQLRDLCNLAHIPKSELDDCLDSSNPKQAYIALLMNVRGFDDDGWQHEQYTQHEHEPQAFDEWEPPVERDPKDIGNGWSNEW